MILLDTQALLWLLAFPELLSVAARQAIGEARRTHGLAISDKTLWELAMMVSRRRVHLNIPLSMLLGEVERVCTVFPINAAIAERSITFGTDFPNDPADRIIAATAIIHGLPLVTSDGAIRNSGEVPCIW